MTQQDSAYIESLREELGLIYAHAIVFFSDITDTTVKNSQHLPWEKDGQQHWETADWRQLTTAQQDVAQKIRKRLADCGARLIEAVRKSVLLERPDEVEVKRMLRGMAAAIVFKDFSYHPPYVVSEEDRVFGIAPAEQEETFATVAHCKDRFDELAEQLDEKLDFLAPTPET